MANKPKRRFRRYIRGAVDDKVALPTLGAGTLVGAALGSVVNERTLVSSIDATWALNEFTDATDVGPIVVGIAHGDYSDAEIEEWIESTGSWNEGDLVSQEIGKRKIRQVGTFEQPASVTQGKVLNDGKPIKTKLNWILLQGVTLKMWAYNSGEGAVATTIPDVRIQGHVNLFPQ